MENLSTVSVKHFISKSNFKSLSIFLILLTLLPLMVLGQAKKKGPVEKQWKKITICHDGNTLEINQNALQAHLDHGDAIGPCEDIQDYDGTVTPVLDAIGKVDSRIGPELTALHASFLLYGSAASDEIFIISENSLVLIEIAVQRGQKQELVRFLSGYSRAEILDKDLSELIVTVLFPIYNLLDLNHVDVQDIIRYVTPVYPAITNSGIVTSLGDIAQQSDNARNAFGVDGDGINVAVLSDSYNLKGFADSDISNGDLPGNGNPDGNTTPVDLVKEYPVTSIGSWFSTYDEGRAMLQIIHDVAPKAKLAFRSGILNPIDMAQGIIDLEAAGYNIIVDDITFFKEPFFQDGVVAQAVNQVTAGDNVQYFTSAGNFGNNSYEAQFNPAGKFHDFFSNNNEVDVLHKVSMGTGFFRIVLQWDDDYYSLPGATNNGAQNDLDIFIINEVGDTLVNNNTNNIGGDPIEIMTFNVDGNFALSNIAIKRASGTGDVNFKYIVFEGKDFKFEEYASGSSTITGHANTTGAMTVGAVLYTNSPAFDNVPSIASFSSWGGLAVNGYTRNNPDFAAPNGANTTVNLNGFDLDSDAFPNFFGTSASAPHAAGVAALLLHAKTKFGEPIDVRQILKQTAIDMGAPGFDDASGSGFIQADAALLTFAAPKPTITEFIIPLDANPGIEPFDLIIKGKNFHQNTRVLLDGAELLAESITIDSATQLTVTLPVFTKDDNTIQAITSAITSSGADGGVSELLYLFRAAKKKVKVIADDNTKHYGETLPVFSATITVDGMTLEDAGLTLGELGLTSLSFNSTANSLAPVGNYIITPVDNTGEGDEAMPIDFYDYEFVNGILTIQKTLLTITPNDLTKVYGEKISGITFSFEYDASKMLQLDNDFILADIMESYSSSFYSEDVIAVLDRGKGIVNRGKGIVNGTGWLITPETLQNRGKGIVNGNFFMDIAEELLESYELDPTDAATNRGKGIVNGSPFFSGVATINRGKGIVNDGALVNTEEGYIGFDNLIVIVDLLDFAVSSLYSINFISGLDVTTEGLEQYIVPGGYFALESNNFEITYGLGNLTITPATLNVVVDDKEILVGDELPEFSSAITGFAYEENESTVFDPITYTPTSYSSSGVYPIVPTLVFTDEVNYIFDPDLIVPGVLRVRENALNGRIVTSTFGECGRKELVIVNSDGSNPIILDGCPEWIDDPHFSSDGTQIVYTKAQGGTWLQDLWKINTDGTGLTQLTFTTHSTQGVFSPDGTKIAFIQNSKVLLMNNDGTQINEITQFAAGTLWPIFSPDGNEIYYTRYRSGWQDSDVIYNDIWKVVISDGFTTQITTGESQYYYIAPELLKDGSRIIYTRAEDSSLNTGNAIMSISIDGSVETETVIHAGEPGAIGEVTVSPDNTKLAFIKESADVLYIMNIDGGNVNEIFRPGTYNVSQPNWGPNPDILIVSIPDPNFEQALIDLGIDSDGIINQQILRSDAEGVTSLNVSNPPSNPLLPNVNEKISDLTGIEAFVNLTSLNCNENQLTSLDITQNTDLTYLSCRLNQLTGLDVSQNTDLTVLSCSLNQLASLDVSQNTALTQLFCASNQLTSLDVSQNTALAHFWCGSNQLVSLDVRNGNNANTTFNARGNIYLSCISVDDACADHSGWDWNIDAGVSFSNDCDLPVYIICNIVLDPDSPAELSYSERVNIAFSYTKLDGDVRIWARPFNDGSIASGYRAHPSPLYTENTGNVDDGFFYFEQDADVDQIRVQIVENLTNEVLFEQFIDVEFNWVDAAVGLSATSSSIETSMTKGNFTVYPNPVKDYLEVVYVDESVRVEEMSIIVTDINGYEKPNVGYLASIVNHGLVLNMIGLPSGIYLVYITALNDGEVFTIQKE